MLKNVLLTTDFSEGSRLAMRRVALLPLHAKAEITVCHVTPKSALYQLDRRLQESATDRLQEEISELKSRLKKNLTIKGVTLSGRPWVEIIHLGKKRKVDLIVIGRHGETKLRHVLLGSTAERVAHAARTPLLVVGETPRLGYQRPLIALDTDELTDNILRVVSKLLDPKKAKPKIIHAWRLPFEYMLAMGQGATALRQDREEAKQMAREGVDALLPFVLKSLPHAKLLFKEGSAKNVIIEQAARLKADLTVLGHHRRSRLAENLLGSVAQEAMRRIAGDVLIVK